MHSRPLGTMSLHVFGAYLDARVAVGPINVLAGHEPLSLNGLCSHWLVILLSICEVVAFLLGTLCCSALGADRFLTSALLAANVFLFCRWETGSCEQGNIVTDDREAASRLPVPLHAS